MTKASSRRWLQGLPVFVLIACAGVARAQIVDHFTDNGYGNPISTMQHPCAEHYHGVTYVAYQGPHEDRMFAPMTTDPANGRDRSRPA